MASVTLTLEHRCAAGAHLRFALTGAKSATVHEDRANLLQPITDDEIAAFVKCFARLVLVGKTPTQALAALEAGVTITV